MIVGSGIDIVSVRKIDRIIAHWGEKFVERVFTENEIRYCRSRKRPAVHYAARFAAKESFMKALGKGFSSGISLREIEVMRDERGKPFLVFYGRASMIVEQSGVSFIHLSLTHTEEFAVAMVILEA
ncbi:MAG: holo-ACP synthase [Syntrophales bacterium]|nr:holo-ACP synthase [Syntrophales bacterium]